MAFGQSNDLAKCLETLTENPHSLKGRWIRRFDEKHFQAGGIMEVQWIAEESISYDVANGIDQIGFLLQVDVP